MKPRHAHIGLAPALLHHWLMSWAKNLRCIAPLAVLMLAACDPGIGLGWRSEVQGRVDPDCIMSALGTVTRSVQSHDYTRPRSLFRAETMVRQISYDLPSNDTRWERTGGYRIDIAPSTDGRTEIYHGWGKLGTEIPPDEKAYVLRVMTKANAAIADQCGISLGAREPKQKWG
ncbi:hypothetical protein [Sphingomonas crusticola]|uniref:hypothetical protein n=1 Tax=Sphingomonas crusticola TaxID=1697973 RepID=UPI000E224EB1|nr:hypothetical protein [Sphingomonas crusticola]